MGTSQEPVNSETLKDYAPCPTHQLWHDQAVQCFYCAEEKSTGTQEVPVEGRGDPMSFTDDADKPIRCDRCGETKPCEIFDTVVLCDPCLVMVLKEWRIRRMEFGELSA